MMAGTTKKSDQVMYVDDVLKNLQECLAESDSKNITLVYDKIVNGPSLNDTDEEINQIIDTLSVLDGQQIADFYNEICNDQIVYDEDSFFHKRTS